MASWAPVDAPEGTAARPSSPPSRVTSTSTVGLPRESRISRATMSMISVMAGALYAPSGSAGKDGDDVRSARYWLLDVAQVDDHDAALRLLFAAVLVAAAYRALRVVRGRQGQLDRRSVALVAIPPITAADLVD